MYIRPCTLFTLKLSHVAVAIGLVGCYFPEMAVFHTYIEAL